MPLMFRNCGRVISWGLVAVVLKRQDLFVVDDQPSQQSTEISGLLGLLAVVGFTDIFWHI